MAVEDDALHALRISKHASMGNLSSVVRSKDVKRVALVWMEENHGPFARESASRSRISEMAVYPNAVSLPRTREGSAKDVSGRLAMVRLAATFQ